MSRFVTPLAYKPSARDGFYLLTEPLVYESDLINLMIIAPAGFETNFVTGKKLFVVRFVVTDQMNAAAVIHDTLYSGGTLSREQSDNVFFEAMLVLDVPRWRAVAAWYAVRIFGGRFYKS